MYSLCIMLTQNTTFRVPYVLLVTAYIEIQSCYRRCIFVGR